jgi:hypothetical protein
MRTFQRLVCSTNISNVRRSATAWLIIRTARKTTENEATRVNIEVGGWRKDDARPHGTPITGIRSLGRSIFASTWSRTGDRDGRSNVRLLRAGCTGPTSQYVKRVQAYQCAGKLSRAQRLRATNAAERQHHTGNGSMLK